MPPVSVDYDGGLVLVDESAGRLFVCNGPAAVVWQALHARDKVAAADALVGAYGISPARAAADCDAIIAQWRHAGLLDAVSLAAPAPRHAAEPEFRGHYAIGGHTVAFAIASSAIGTSIEAMLRSCRVETCEAQTTIRVAPAAEGGLDLSVNGRSYLRAPDSREIVGGIWQAILEKTSGRSQWLGILHAAAIHRDGKALLISAPSGSGKSTLAAGLRARGYGYAADDLAALAGPDGRLQPLPLPQSLKAGAWDVLASLLPDIASLPATEAFGKTVKFLPTHDACWETDALPVCGIVFPRYAPSAPAGATRLPPLEAFARLAGDRLWLGHPLCASSVAAFLDWLEPLPAFEISYSSFDEADRLVRAVIDA